MPREHSRSIQSVQHEHDADARHQDEDSIHANSADWRFARGAGVVLLAILLAIALTYPLAFKLDHVGRLNTGDCQFSLWNVSWVAHALTTNPRTLFQANIFYPHTNTLAYSESNILNGALGIPVYLATRNPFAAHNTVVLLGFVFSFLSAYGLARYLTGSSGVALLTAIAFAYCPFIFARMAHVQLLMTFGLPLSLLAMHRLVDRPTLTRGAALAGALIAQALACAYYGVFAALAVMLGVMYYAASRRLWKDSRYWTAMVFAAALTLLGVGPVFLPYRSLQENLGFVRTLDDAGMYSADWRAWLASSAHAHQWLLARLTHWNEVLFPGMLTTGLGLAGLWFGFRAKPEAIPGPSAGRMRETTIFYAVIGAIAFWASFGPQAGLFTALYDTIPIFSFLRAPARFGIMVALALSVLLAIAVRALLAKVGERRKTKVIAGLACALVAELTTAPLVSLVDATEPDQAYRLLATLPRGPLVEMPFFSQRSDFRRHAEYMLASTYHWQPLINGYSDHIPNDFRKIVDPVSAFPSADAFRLLRARQARYVMFHWNYYDRVSMTHARERLETYKDCLTLLSQTEHVWLFEITAWPESRDLGTR